MALRPSGRPGGPRGPGIGWLRPGSDTKFSTERRKLDRKIHADSEAFTRTGHAGQIRKTCGVPAYLRVVIEKHRTQASRTMNAETAQAVTERVN